MLKEKDFDIVLSDCKMPEMDGLELLYRARNMKPKVDVILMTAYATISSAVLAIKSGGVDYIQNPSR